jgi:hypothetical protein
MQYFSFQLLIALCVRFPTSSWCSITPTITKTQEQAYLNFVRVKSAPCAQPSRQGLVSSVAGEQLNAAALPGFIGDEADSLTQKSQGWQM